MIRYRVKGDGDVRPQAVECEPVGYPHPDADGCTQYENTHYDDEQQAWNELLANRRAGVDLSVRFVRDAEARLEQARAALVRDTMLRHDAEENYRAWLDGREAPRAD